MAFPSSPLPLRSPDRILESPIARATSNGKSSRLEIFDDDNDEDEMSTVSQSPYFTQPTQIIDSPTLRKPQSAIPSSPIIEVPASSPFKSQSSATKFGGGRLANLMAPAGTAYRAPVRQAATTAKPSSKKREFIMISDDEFDSPIYAGDSSDNDTPMRGDIRPSSFQKKPSITSSFGATTTKGTKKPVENKASPSTNPQKPIVLDDWILPGSSLPQRSNRDFLPPKPSPPKPPRRRLIQGRRPRQESPSSPDKLIESPPPPPPRISSRKVVSLISDDEDEDETYKRVKGASPEPTSSPAKGNSKEQAFNERVLNYLNSCDVIQLVAIANIKEDTAKIMLSHQPFKDIQDAQKVSMPQKKGRNKKSTRVSIGEDIVSAVKSYARALDGIDHVIAVCEAQAEAIKAATSTWNLDQTGQRRSEIKNEDGKPMTPLSVGDSAKLVAPPLRQPKHMDGNCEMKPFQVYGLNWLYLLYENQYGGILADDMGLGKTCQVISLMASIVEDWQKNGNGDDDDNRPWPNLIFVPPSTLANWKAEFKKFAPGLNVTLYQGSQLVRDEIADEILDDPARHHVVLTSYTQVSRQEDIANLRRLQPMVAVFDEGHKMKNPKTKLYKDLLRITAAWRLILSGTPVQNNLMEMVSLLQFVEPDLFKDHFDDLEALFNQKLSLSQVSQGALLKSERVGRARTILEPFILQRRKEQVLKDLPPKTARVVYCEMDKTQKSIYQDYDRRFRKGDTTVSKDPASGGRENDNNNVWIQLRKAAIHPQLFRRFFTDSKVEKIATTLMKYVPQSELRQPNLVHLTNELKALSDFELHLWCRDYKCIRKFDLPDGSWLESAKVEALLKLVREYEENGDRVLVFTRFAKVIEILGESLASEGISYLSLQGNTDVSERQELINEFNNDSSIPVFLLTTGSGGTGINLTAANKVIIFDQSDNPQDDIQAENRAHRLGQKRPVEIIRLISKDTVEELVYKACQKKLELANKVTGWAAVEMTQSEMEAAVREEYLNKSAPISDPESSDGLSSPPDSD